jgi:hypothetical protein
MLVLKHGRKKWTSDQRSDFVKLCEAIDKRFPDAKFMISCFESIDEIETKVLTDADAILYTDRAKICGDYFLVKKREGQTHIRFCDVIDTLIANNFDKNRESRRYDSLILDTTKNQFC